MCEVRRAVRLLGCLLDNFAPPEQMRQSTTTPQNPCGDWFAALTQERRMPMSKQVSEPQEIVT